MINLNVKIVDRYTLTCFRSGQQDLAKIDLFGANEGAFIEKIIQQIKVAV